MAKPDTAGRRTKGAIGGWEIRRRKQLEREEALIEAAVAPLKKALEEEKERSGCFFEALQGEYNRRNNERASLSEARGLARAFARQLQGMGVTLGLGGDAEWLWEKERGD